MVFILTDGQPTDNWRNAAKELRSLKPRPSKIYTIGIGDEIDFSVLKEIGDVTFHVADVDDGRLEDLFVWMSASIQSASINLEKNNDEADAQNLPAGVEAVGDDYAAAPDFPRQLFFHYQCCSTKKYYMARYKYNDEIGRYAFAESYPVDEEFYADSAGSAPQVDNEKIADCPICPYCGRKAWFICSCKCNTDMIEPGERCPKCGNEVEGFQDFAGTLDRSLG